MEMLENSNNKIHTYNFIGNIIMVLSLSLSFSLVPVVSSALVIDGDKKNINDDSKRYHISSILTDYINEVGMKIIGFRSEVEIALKQKEMNAMDMGIGLDTVEFKEEYTHMLPETGSIGQERIDSSNAMDIKNIKMELKNIEIGLDTINQLEVINDDNYIGLDKKSIMNSLATKWFYIKRFKMVASNIFVNSPSLALIYHIDGVFDNNYNGRVYGYDDFSKDVKEVVAHVSASFASIGEKAKSFLYGGAESSAIASENVIAVVNVKDRSYDSSKKQSEIVEDTQSKVTETHLAVLDAGDDIHQGRSNDNKKFTLDDEEEIEVEADLDEEQEKVLLNYAKTKSKPSLSEFMTKLEALETDIRGHKWANYEEKQALRSAVKRIGNRCSQLYHPDLNNSVVIPEFVLFNSLRADLIDILRNTR
ncbi:MAG: hypothetical protein QS748_06945 [Candidatus Endonucleobacter bathymodioli]|uniref:Uncharacterized protein n=1 Tax=Candidatus Endonucleibacter bathymodioli TaxID=539814 RepID=A0AA90SXU4_9GAMM|nr:hypothetical protein [Candidatus Endonucleobacter bathymodioli]